MTQLSNEQLKKTFHQDMIILFKRIRKELKYKPPRLMDLINKYGGYEAAVKYITSENNVQDFAVLWENQRLDLSVEALIIKPCYRELFLEDIVSYCDKKLADYNYAPNVIEEEPEEEPISYYSEAESIGEEMHRLKADYLVEQEIKETTLYKCYYEGVAITQEMWRTILTNAQIVTSKNLDLLLRIYLIGDQVTPSDLSQEEGYSATYPYNEVVTALGKRIKAFLKVDVPLSDEGTLLWWHLLFVGGVKDNKAFEWSLRKKLRGAMDELVNEGVITLDGVEVKTQNQKRELHEKEIEEKEPEEVEIEEDDGLSDFDRLFASIMGTEVTTSAKKDKHESKDLIEEPNKAVINSSNVMQMPSTPSSVITEVNAPIVHKESIESNPIQEQNAEVQEKTTEMIKKECIEYYGAICDICGFDYGYIYGEAFEMQIDVHNIKQRSDTEILSTTHPIEDLIPVCHNCHHLLHHTELTLEQMRKIVKA